MNWLTSSGFGSSGCCREKASSRCVNMAARCAPRMALSSARVNRDAAPPLRSPSWRCAVLRLPMTMVSKLLKSCATLPESWPTAYLLRLQQPRARLLEHLLGQALSYEPFPWPVPHGRQRLVGSWVPVEDNQWPMRIRGRHEV